MATAALALVSKLPATRGFAQLAGPGQWPARRGVRAGGGGGGSGGSGRQMETATGDRLHQDGERAEHSHKAGTASSDARAAGGPPEGQEVRHGAEHQECAGEADHRAPAAAAHQPADGSSAAAGTGHHVPGLRGLHLL
uniref:Poly(U) binding splicing factor 60 n=1 Tax=Pipistrellus kuhlii TaxID=59472 RepID=A0A7J7VN69_PIPKU|nr:poly(U) binding splicing factor 60 [Pipistrellus kuhlii]